jgi:hypothetical protein
MYTVIRQSYSSLTLRATALNKINAATILVISGLIGYILLRFSLPALQVERLIFIAVLSIIGLTLMFIHRREAKDNKKAAERQSKE